MDIIKSLKRCGVALGVALCSAVSFAEGAAGTYDFSQVTTEATAIKEGVSTWMGNFFPVVMGLAGLFLILWLGRLALRALKSMGNAGK